MLVLTAVVSRGNDFSVQAVATVTAAAGGTTGMWLNCVELELLSNLKLKVTSSEGRVQTCWSPKVT